MKHSIRTATLDDVPVLVDFMTKLTHHVKFSSNDPYMKEMHEKDMDIDFARTFCAVINHSQPPIYVSEHEGKISAFIQGSVSRPFIRSSKIKKIGQIDLCWVEPEYRRLGVAQALCEHLENWFRKNQITHVDLQFLVGNVEAENSWHKLGYHSTRIIATKAL